MASGMLVMGLVALLVVLLALSTQRPVVQTVAPAVTPTRSSGRGVVLILLVVLGLLLLGTAPHGQDGSPGADTRMTASEPQMQLQVEQEMPSATKAARSL